VAVAVALTLLTLQLEALLVEKGSLNKKIALLDQQL
jgi:hypothetical protein